MKKYFKGIVWPHGKIEEDNKTNYKYVVVGILVSDSPIESFEGKNEIVVEGDATQDMLIENLSQRESNIRVGDATSVLLNLKDV